MARKKKQDILKSMPSDKHIGDVIDVLVNQAYQILSWKIIDAMSPAAVTEPEGLPKGYYAFKHDKLDEIIELVKPLLTTVEQSRKIKVETIKDITTGLKKGTISLSEAQDLIKLLNDKQDLEGF